jgi:hypothetical protein
MPSTQFPDISRWVIAERGPIRLRTTIYGYFANVGLPTIGKFYTYSRKSDFAWRKPLFSWYGTIIALNSPNIKEIPMHPMKSLSAASVSLGVAWKMLAINGAGQIDAEAG